MCIILVTGGDFHIQKEGVMLYGPNDWVTVSEGVQLLDGGITRQNIIKHIRSDPGQRKFRWMRRGNVYLVHRDSLLTYMNHVSPRGTPRVIAHGKSQQFIEVKDAKDREYAANA